jgi:DNA-binding NtrC family response regulator
MDNSLAPSFPIVVVDDEEAILFSIDTLLRMAGLNNIITCNDSRKVMNILSSQKIEIILLDLSMPHLPGEKVLSMVAEEFPEVPVVIITAAANENSAVRCMELGAFDYVIKPLEEAPLVTAVNQAMSFRKTNSVLIQSKSLHS